LLGVLLLFSTVAGVVLRYRSFFLGAIGKFTKTSFPEKVRSKEKLVEVVATHRLDPKKSITIVRVGKKQFILGVTSESINLISELRDDPSYADEETVDSDFFSDVLSSESGKPLESSIRSRIKSRLEGLKQL
jgi:flagellar biogenesis protein FliO